MFAVFLVYSLMKTVILSYLTVFLLCKSETDLKHNGRFLCGSNRDEVGIIGTSSGMHNKLQVILISDKKLHKRAPRLRSATGDALGNLQFVTHSKQCNHKGI